VAEFLAPLPVGRLWGVGEVTEAALRKLGVATIGDLVRLPEAALAAALGPERAHAMRELASGRDERDVVPDEGVKSVGGEETFDVDVRGEAALGRCLLLQAARVGRRLRAHGLRGRVVTLKVKYADFTLVTRRVTLPRPTDDDAAIYEAARAQLTRIDPSRAVRLAGVTVSGFEEQGAAEPAGQLDLFGAAAGPGPVSPGAGGTPEARRVEAEEARRRRLNAAVDALSERFGTGAVKKADLVDEEVREAWPSHRRRDRE
jgi:DNA polymerase-4